MKPSKSLVGSIKSNFVTIDLARKVDGSLIITEMGDGQVSGLQELSAKDFYDAIARIEGNIGQ
ncbi:hypothetical protein FC52_GL001027 [Lactobacillus pasteurii DSM 23907 = CRBIP 24.76]|uniref:ATP-grasp domain-containing protein n=1 Tax=Lactobacillus pasteurii DSM 23907 = CRBIP 24.76 TaxID=1423790 RepID=I7KL07_9LACO|nr:hypothetical protein FC52_GL001027 [Lactobacillus pasteurii DSM 23907 = CRBIP 24.76]TDG77411.1 hypothetical protein C5L33_000854 [Lactobacillus pasteurii]CCI84959.1 Putative uncharacterized protein [Lactobacillus pasteurii DSM 23907 = CRBIP 24.76]